MAAIPHRRSAASRPTVHLVLQPSRVKLWPFSGGQVVNIYVVGQGDQPNDKVGQESP